MSTLIKMSEATALGLHAMAYLAMSRDERINAASLAKVCNASESHMIKVCQRLAKAGFLATRRGIGGGFSLQRDPDDIVLADIYRVFDGELSSNHCLFATAACRQGVTVPNCILGSAMIDINHRIITYFTETRLSDIAANCHQALEGQPVTIESVPQDQLAGGK